MCVCDICSSTYLYPGNIEFTLYIHFGREDMETVFCGGEVFILPCKAALI